MTLSPAALDILHSLRTLGPSTLIELMEDTGRTRGVVERALHKLCCARVAEQLGRRAGAPTGGRGPREWMAADDVRRPRVEDERSGARLTEADVRAIRTYPAGASRIAQLFGISRTMVQHIRARRKWAHVE